ncbi:MAG: phytoene desaturase family protein [Bacillota bacterium]
MKKKVVIIGGGLGGMYKIAEAMSKLLHELEVNVHFNTKVKRILTSGSQATGVELENGIIFEADIVVSNLEAIPTYNTLLKDHSLTPQVNNELDKYSPTVSGLVLLLGVNKSFSIYLIITFSLVNLLRRSSNRFLMKGYQPMIQQFMLEYHLNLMQHKLLKEKKTFSC